MQSHTSLVTNLKKLPKKPLAVSPKTGQKGKKWKKTRMAIAFLNIVRHTKMSKLQEPSIIFLRYLN